MRCYRRAKMDADEQQWQELADEAYFRGIHREKSVSVYRAINAVQAELAKSGIAKDSTNAQQNYKFRGIDAVYNALAPLLAKHGLCILPRVVSREVVERQSAKGGALFYVTVGEDFASLVWHGLTTPQRDASRRLRSTKGSAVAA